MTPLDSLGSVIGAPVRVGDIRVGEVAGALVDASQHTAIGLVIAGPGAMRRFLPWIAATFEGGSVYANSALLLVDGSESYERRGAVVVDERHELATSAVAADGRLAETGAPVSRDVAAGTPLE